MVRALISSFSQLGDPAFVRLFFRSLLLTLLLFVMIGLAAIIAARMIAAAYGGSSDASLAAAAAAGLAVIVSGWLLFRAVAILVMGLFADQIVAAVEHRHYPVAAALARVPGTAVTLRLALMSVLRLLVVNLLAIPFYALLLVTGIGPALLFFFINAVLLGRDLGEMVAVRYLDSEAQQRWLRVTRGQLTIMGVIVTGLFMIPIVNLVAPIIGAAMATHLFHARRT